MSQYDKFTEWYIKERNSNKFNPNRHLEMPAMFKLVGNIKNKKILDLGCGFGEHAAYYSRKGAKIIGLDISKKELAYAKKRNIKNAEFKFHNLNKKLPFKKNTFDMITCSLVLDHIKNLKPFFRESHRVLKKNGIMIFSIPNPIFYQEQYIAGGLREKGKIRIFGDYFKRRKITSQWGGKWKSQLAKVEVTHYHKPLEDYTDAFIEAGFTLIKYHEPKPITPNKEFKKKIPYKIWSRNPYFLFFKLKK